MKIIILKDKIGKCTPIIPNDVLKLTQNKIQVSFQRGIGDFCGFNDNEYIKNGATLIKKINKKTLSQFDIICSFNLLKTKYYKMVNKNQLIWSYGYLVNNTRELFKMVKWGINTVSCESINKNGVYEYLEPIEKIKGVYAPILATNLLVGNNKVGRGKLLPKINELTSPTEIMIINYSYAAYYAIKSCIALGANITFLECNNDLCKIIQDDKSIKELLNTTKATLKIDTLSFDNLNKYVKNTNVLIVTNQLPTTKTTQILNTQQINNMRKGGVFINLSSDTGFASWTEQKPNNDKKISTSFNNINIVSIQNITNLFPYETSLITSKLNANHFINMSKCENIKKSICSIKEIKAGIITYKNCITNLDIARSLHLQYINIDKLL